MRAFLTPDTLPTEFVCRRVRIPDSIEWLEVVNGALSVLTHSYNFQLDGSITPEQCAEVFTDMFLEYQRGDACLLGSILLYAVDTLPDGILACDGSTYDRVDYPRLYSILSTSYVVDADTFNVPNLYQGDDMKYGIVAR